MIYIKENIITYKNKQYERLYNAPTNHKYRVIFSSDDYDYVEDEELIKTLDNVNLEIIFEEVVQSNIFTKFSELLNEEDYNDLLNEVTYFASIFKAK